MTDNNKWYEKTPAIVLLLIFFFPVGLYLMWKYTNWTKAAKIGVSVLAGIVVIAALANPSSPNTDNTASEDNPKQTDSAIEKHPEAKQPTPKPYAYDWNEEVSNTYWVLVEDFDNTNSDFKDRVKATIANFQNKVSFTTNTLVSVTDSSITYKCETLAGKPDYTIQKYIACFNDAGGKDAYNKENSSHNIALYSNDYKYNDDGTDCTDKCNQLIFYPDASSDSAQAKYKEATYWKPQE